jgi:DNA-binding YbaB/EbfC family protein
MNNPFKELGQLAGLMRQLPKIKEEVERYQERVAQLSAEGDAGGGLVQVRVNGKMEVLACRLSEEALRLNDREMLEDLIRAAVNQALDRVRKLVAEETGKMATGLGLPPGMGLPGLQLPGS